MQELEVEARSCYSEVIDMESRKFAEMLLLDSCFVIQLFIPRKSMVQELKDPLDRSIWLEVYLLQDLLPLGNQLPYFIFDHLLSVLNIPELAGFRFHECILGRLDEVLLRFFNLSPLMGSSPMEPKRAARLLHTLIEKFSITLKKESNTVSSSPQSQQVSSLKEPNQDFKVDHLLHLLHERILRIPWRKKRHTGSSSGPQSLQKPSLVVPTVTELVEAGIDIKVRQMDNFLNISFDKRKGLLEIPTIQVDDSTNLIIRNLIALEQCCKDVGMQITCYSIFMDAIIDTEKDVALLSQKGIIDRRLVNDRDIALVFQRRYV
uniref:UPF0481 protein At3g02645 n=1 Tax=Elaeis guineensis var. tenera TaxID=51953 RepID=A0A6J0PDC5_ELAGV|nr:putative UPF0481 protein At3g02645 [Elaeis guineensis]